MSRRYLSPGGGGGFVDNREPKTSLAQLAEVAAPIMEQVGGPFSVRLAVAGESRAIFKFPGVPGQPVDLPIPALEPEKYGIDGWLSISTTVEFSPGNARLVFMGRFNAGEKVPWTVEVQLAKDTAGESGEDSFVIRGRDGTVDATTIFDIMQVRLRSGDPKYARFSDTYPTLDVEGVLAIITRYVKDMAERKGSAQSPEPQPAAQPQPPAPPEGPAQ